MPVHCASGRRPGRTLLLAFLLAAATSPGGLRAQEVPPGDTLRPPPGRFTLPAGLTLRVGAQLQFDLVAIQDPPEGEVSGFRVDDARIRFYGTLPRDLSWRLTTDAGSLLDVRVEEGAPPGSRWMLVSSRPPLTGEYIDSSRNLAFAPGPGWCAPWFGGGTWGSSLALGKAPPWLSRPAFVHGGWRTGRRRKRGGSWASCGRISCGTGTGETPPGGRLPGGERRPGGLHRAKGLERRYQSVEQLVSADVRLGPGAPALLRRVDTGVGPGRFGGGGPLGWECSTVGGRPPWGYGDHAPTGRPQPRGGGCPGLPPARGRGESPAHPGTPPSWPTSHSPWMTRTKSRTRGSPPSSGSQLNFWSPPPPRFHPRPLPAPPVQPSSAALNHSMWTFVVRSGTPEGRCSGDCPPSVGPPWVWVDIETRSRDHDDDAEDGPGGRRVVVVRDVGWQR